MGANVRAEIDSNCYGNPQVDAVATARTTVEVFSGGNLPVNANVDINFANIFHRNFPFNFNVPVPSFSTLPVDLPPSSATTLEFGAFDGNSFTPSSTPTHKDVPININLGSFGGTGADNRTLIIDATVGQPHLAEVTAPNDAQA